MKKIMIFLGALTLSGTMFAQKPASSDSKYSLEGMINYDLQNGVSWNAPNLRARYFVNDNIAARVTLGLGATDTTMNVYEATPGTGMGAIKDKTMQWSLGLGGEYHLAGTERLSPYFSAGLMFGGGSNKSTGTDVKFGGYSKGDSFENKSKNSMLGLGVGAGFDYYVLKNIYLGLELGYNWMKYTDKGSTSSSTISGTTTSSETKSTGSTSGMNLGGGNLGFRIGWRF
jgi:outer membrane protein W